MPARLQLLGRRYGRLTVIAYADSRSGNSYWICRCDCGNTKTVGACGLQQSTIRSCGCLQHETHITHGMTRTPEYAIYCAAKQRCETPTCAQYKDYGGRGIEFRFTSFEHFITHIGRRPSKVMTLDRLDNDGHYEPGNVRWATRKQQARNRRGTRLSETAASDIRSRYSPGGVKQQELADKYGVSDSTISALVTDHTWQKEQHI